MNGYLPDSPEIMRIPTMSQFRTQSNIRPCEASFINKANFNQINAINERKLIEKKQSEFRCKVINNPLTPFKYKLDDAFSYKDYAFDAFFKELKVIKSLKSDKTDGNVFAPILTENGTLLSLC